MSNAACFGNLIPDVVCRPKYEIVSRLLAYVTGVFQKVQVIDTTEDKRKEERGETPTVLEQKDKVVYLRACVSS